MTSHAFHALANAAYMLRQRFGEQQPAQIVIASGDSLSVEGVFVEPSQLRNTGYNIEFRGKDPAYLVAAADVADVSEGDRVTVNNSEYVVAQEPVLDPYGVQTLLLLRRS